MTPESTGPVGRRQREVGGRAQGDAHSSHHPGLCVRDGDCVSRLTQCLGLTCSQETKGHKAEEPGAHGSFSRPLPAEGGVSWGEQSKVLNSP